MAQIHAVASELLTGAEELPWHATQLAPSAAEYLPTPQSVQVFELVAPVAVEDVPGGQMVHAEAAVPAKYVSARQFWQVVAFEALANLPARQAVHDSVYMPREKRPGEQSIHILAPQ